MNLISLISLSALSVNALRLQTIGRRSTPLDGLKQRDQGSSVLGDLQDVTYTANVSLNAQSFPVIIDTASADLVIVGSVNNAVDSGVTGSVQYAGGSVKGSVKFATLDFDGYIVSNQAYLEATSNDATSGLGVLGLGPPSASSIANSSGYDPKFASAVDRMFATDYTTPNIVTFLLGRTDDADDVYEGQISIAEVIPSYTNITSQPQLDVVLLQNDIGSQQFSILLDANGVIGPNGQPISLTSGVTGAKNPNQLTAILDSGRSFSQVPESVSDAIYSSIQGAVLSTLNGNPIWTIPCNMEINVTFIIGGVKFPVHPLDTNFDPSLAGLSVTKSPGQSSCIGAFQPITTPSTEFDIILAAAFLRNAYTLLSYGDFIEETSNKRGEPYVQLLPITNPAIAHNDFVKLRLNGQDTTGTQVLQGAIGDSSSSSGSSTVGGIAPNIVFIIGIVALGVAIIIFIIIVVVIIRQRRHKDTRNLGAYRSLNSGFVNGPGREHSDLRAYNPEEGQVVYDTESYEKEITYENPFDHRT